MFGDCWYGFEPWLFIIPPTGRCSCWWDAKKDACCGGYCDFEACDDGEGFLSS